MRATVTAPNAPNASPINHRMPCGGPVGGHGDVFSGGVTMDRDCKWPIVSICLLVLLVFTCSLVMLMFDLNAFRRRHPTRIGLTGMLTSAQLVSG